MRKHISEVGLCDGDGFHRGLTHLRSDCERDYHKDDFCLLCGYFMEGDRLYLEIHGSDGALNRIKDIDSAQPYVCMECAGQFKAHHKDHTGKYPYAVVRKLQNFIKEGKK